MEIIPPLDRRCVSAICIAALEADRMSVFQLAGPDMLIDGYDQYNQRQDADVVNITPDDASEGPAEEALLADDCTYPQCLYKSNIPIPTESGADTPDQTSL